MNNLIPGVNPVLARTFVGQHSTGRQPRFCPSLMALACLSALQAAPASAASLSGAGFLSDATLGLYSVATGVSADGSVVIGNSAAADGFDHAFRWSSAGMQDIGVPGGFNNASAWGVSADGSAIAGTIQDNAHIEAFRWTVSGGFELLGTNGSYVFSEGRAVSADGETVVGVLSAPIAGDPLMQAFRWDASHGMRLFNLLPGATMSEATGVSGDGKLIVGNQFVPGAASTWRGFYFIDSGIPMGDVIGFLPSLSPVSNHSFANAVSSDGKYIVGAASSATQAGSEEAFRYSVSEDKMLGLGFLTGGVDSYANAVSADGTVVVGFDREEVGFGSEFTAFRWTEQGGMKSIAAELSAQGVNVGAWKLKFANGVSADGKTVVGEGTNPDGKKEAFIARFGNPVTAGGPALLGITDFTNSVASLGAVSHLPAEVARVAVANEVPGLSGLTGFSAAPVYQHISGSRGDLGGAALTWRQPGVALAGQVGHLNAATSGLHDGGRGDYRGWWLGAAASLGLGELLNQPAIDGLELDAAIRTGRYDTDINRNYLNGITVESARGNTDTRDLTALARVGWRFAVADTVHLIPHLQVLHSRTHVDGYDETSGTLAGRVSAQKRNNLETSAGVTAAWQVRPDLELRGRYSLNHLRDNTGAPVSVTVAGLGTFGAGDTQYDSNWHEFGAGADWAITEKIRLNASAIRTAGSNYPENWALRVAVNFGL